MKKIHNVSPGHKIFFLHFRGENPATAIFSYEKFEGGFFGTSALIGVPLRGRPKTPAAARRAISWARRQVLDVLVREVA